MINPYLGYGKAVYGERLVGRTKELQILTERILYSTASISIIGQRRIGKTSLVTETLRLVKSKEPNFIIVSVDLSSFPNSKSLFDAILEETTENYFENKKELPLNFGNIFEKTTSSSYESYRRCRRGLKMLWKSGVGTKIIIDEFDAVRKFKDAEQIIQWLRELIDKSYETGVSITFVSRRSLYSIEKHLIDISNLDGVCEKFYVKPLDEAGLVQMTHRCQNSWHISENELEVLKWYTGGHPYLAEMILCYSWEYKSVEKGAKRATGDILGVSHLSN